MESNDIMPGEHLVSRQPQDDQRATMTATPCHTPAVDFPRQQGCAGQPGQAGHPEPRANCPL